MKTGTAKVENMDKQSMLSGQFIMYKKFKVYVCERTEMFCRNLFLLVCILVADIYVLYTICFIYLIFIKSIVMLLL